MNSKRARIVLSLTGILFLIGCGGESIRPVRGKVTIKGGAIPTGASVVFQDLQREISASGIVGNDGKYQLTSKTLNDGAPPGKYSVTIHGASATDSSQDSPPRVFAEKYENPTTSGFSAEVKASGNEFNFELDPP